MQRIVPEQFIPAHRPGRISVWTRPDDVTIVSDPQVEGDTLSGLVFDERWAVPLKSVVKVEATASDRKLTALFFAGVAASAVGAYAMATGGRGAGGIPCGQGLTPGQITELCGSMGH